MNEYPFDMRQLLPMLNTPYVPFTGVPTAATPVFPPAAQPSEGPPPFAPAPTATRVPEMKTVGGDPRNVPGKDPWYDQLAAWAKSGGGKETLAALAKGMGGGGGTGPVAPPFRASASGGASPDPTAHLKGQGKSMMDALLQQLGKDALLQPMGKLGGKPGRKASDRYDILARGGR